VADQSDSNFRNENKAFERRETDISQHPIVTKKYTVITKAIESAYTIVRDRVFMRRTGLILYASPRTGKTYCANALRSILASENPDKYIVYLPCVQSGAARSAILKDILALTRATFSYRKGASEIRDRLVLHIASMSTCAGGNHFILIIDEMHLLKEADYVQLLILNNWLEQADIQMTTIGFAQPEVLEQRSALQAVKADQLVARFMCETISFHGCSRKEDLLSILSAYDDSLVFPEGSSTSYTEYFLPKAFKSGARLSLCCDIFWTKLILAIEGSSRDSIPMEYIIRSTEYLLIMSFPKDGPDFYFSEEAIIESIKASSLSDFVRVISGDERHG
jgi:hypothetical protein